MPQNLPVNIVFLGYTPGSGPQDIDVTKFAPGLPATYRTVNRYPGFYGNRQYNGVDFTFRYNTTFASSAFTNAFFNYLTSISVPAARTIYQDAYNAQSKKAAVSVTQNYFIDAVSVEKWLARNAPTYGIDTTQYTVFYVNWFGRQDFKFHVYVKTDERSRYRLQLRSIRASRKMIGWGGTGVPCMVLRPLRRSDSFTNNFDVDNADITGNGVLDYRIPPIWEYGNLKAYRKFDNLSGDLLEGDTLRRDQFSSRLRLCTRLRCRHRIFPRVSKWM